MATPESKIQTAICKELRSQGLFFWRQNNMATWDPKLGIYRGMGEYALKGIPDIFLIKPPYGTLVGLEVKTEKGKLSADQHLFKRRLERAGGQYHVLRSLDDLKSLLPTLLSTVD